MDKVNAKESSSSGRDCGYRGKSLCNDEEGEDAGRHWMDVLWDGGLFVLCYVQYMTSSPSIRQSWEDKIKEIRRV